MPLVMKIAITALLVAVCAWPVFAESDEGTRSQNIFGCIFLSAALTVLACIIVGVWTTD
jgi:hypothetical protein